MKRISLDSLRIKLISLVLITILPALSLLFYAGLHERAHSRDHALQDALDTAKNISAAQDASIDNIRSVMILISQMMSEHEHSSEILHRMFVRLGPQMPAELSGFIIANPKGDVLESTYPNDPKINISDRPFFQRLLQAKEFFIGEYIISRITGQPILPLYYPVLDKTGKVKFIVGAGLHLNGLHRFIDKGRLPPGTHLTIVDRKGTVLLRYPETKDFLGKSLHSAPIVGEMLDKKEGVVELPDLHGETRLYGFTSFGQPVGAVYVSVGIPSKEAFADVNASTVNHLIWFMIVSCMVLMLAWFGGDIFIVRSLNRLLRSAKRVENGEMSARVGGPYGKGEIGKLSQAFDHMLEALQKREEEKEQAEEAMRESEKRYRNLVETSPDAIFFTDTSGVIRMVNKRSIELFGMDGANALVGRHLYDFIVKNEVDNASEHFTDVFATGNPVKHQHTLLRNNGTAFPAEINAKIVQDEAGHDRGVIAIIRDISESRQKDEQIQTHLRRLTALRDIDMAITGSFDLRVTLQVILDQVTSQLAVDAALVLLLNEHSLLLEYSAGRGFLTSALQHTRLRLGQGNAGLAARERRIVQNTLPDESGHMERSPLLAKEGFQTYYAVPLIAKGHVKGVLELFHRKALTANREWLDFLNALAVQAAIAIDNAALFHDLERSNIDLKLAYDTTLEGWSRALDLRDRETEGHSRRVTEITVRVAKALGISDSEIVHIRRGALLHDIGKMAVPDSILLKPGPLTDEEWEIMRKHPVYAYELLQPIDYLRPAIDIPYSHHEKWDGSGYPRGLKGENIPIAGRIFALVDVWDALSSDRPYRAAWPREKVTDYIKEQAGKHFDPKVVELFIEFMDVPEELLRK